jgi:uncharacterized membrane protein (DUF106 family)
MAVNEILNPVLQPLLDISAFMLILIVTLFVAALTTVVYKYTTDQAHLKQVKAELKRLQDKMKKLKDKPDKMMKVQQEVLKLNGEYMKSSLKSTLYTFLPLIIVFGWMSANLLYEPLTPNEPFGVQVELDEGTVGTLRLVLEGDLATTGANVKNVSSSVVSFSGIIGPAGEQTLSVLHEQSGEEQFATFLITDDQTYYNPVTQVKDSDIFEMITVQHKKLLVFQGVPVFESIPWIKNFGWFGAYFLFSIIFSTAFRKALKVA